MQTVVYKHSESEIQTFYAGRSVFITGVTGFLGKLLLEKLLRCCPDIKKVYLLIRPKRDISPEKRLEILLNTQNEDFILHISYVLSDLPVTCFRFLEEECPNFRDKAVHVSGDLVEPLCGISDEDLAALQKDVTVVLHSGANVNFLANLRKSIQSNVIGARNVMEICKRLPQLQSFVHISTAFVRRNPDYTVPEEVGECHVQPKDIINLLSFLDDEVIKKIAPNLIKDKVTTYQLSKALAELLVVEEKEDLPTAIIRPSLINNSWKEPIPGWCDMLQGISGLMIAAGRGFLRTLYAPPNSRFLAIPVDVVVNCTIASSWYTATRRPEGAFVVNCTTEHDDSPLSKELMMPILKLKDKYPLASIFRCPDFRFYECKWKDRMYTILDHYIPSIIIDTLLFIFTGKTIMFQLYRKIENVWSVYREQGNTPWYFARDNYKRIQNALSAKDTEIFFMETDTLDWWTYLEDSVRVGRIYMCKDDLSTLPYAARKAKIWWLVTTIMKWLLIFFLISYVVPQSFIDSLSSNFESWWYGPKPEFNEEAHRSILNENEDTLLEI